MIWVGTLGCAIAVLLIGPQDRRGGAASLEEMLPGRVCDSLLPALRASRGEAVRSQREAAVIGQGAAHERGGRRAGEFLEVAREMRLVRIAAGIGERSKARDGAASRPAQGAIEAQDPAEQFRRDAEFARKAHRQMLAAAADLFGERGDGKAAAARLQSLRGKSEIGGRRPARAL